MHHVIEWVHIHSDLPMKTIFLLLDGRCSLLSTTSRPTTDGSRTVGIFNAARNISWFASGYRVLHSLTLIYKWWQNCSCTERIIEDQCFTEKGKVTDLKSIINHNYSQYRASFWTLSLAFSLARTWRRTMYTGSINGKSPLVIITDGLGVKTQVDIWTKICSGQEFKER